MGIRFIDAITHKVLHVFGTNSWISFENLFLRQFLKHADHRLALTPKIVRIRTERRSLENERKIILKEESKNMNCATNERETVEERNWRKRKKNLLIQNINT